MKNKPVELALAVVFLAASVACGTTRSAGNCTVNDSIDGGGKRTSSANYTMDGSLGGIGGISTFSTPSVTNKNGYIAQLAEVSQLSITASASMPEGTTSQLGALATLDDNTLILLSGSALAWSPVAYPLSSISASGLLSAGIVYADAYGSVTGLAMGITAPASILIVNSAQDDFGTYSGDGLPDSWQVQYYGTNNANAGPTVDLFGTGNNQFKYVCGLNPTNPASRFLLQVGNLPNQASWKAITFSPRWTNRTYWVQSRTNLISGSFENLGSFSNSDNGTERTVTDLDAGQPRKFYRVRISFP